MRQCCESIIDQLFEHGHNYFLTFNFQALFQIFSDILSKFKKQLCIFHSGNYGAHGDLRWF